METILYQYNPWWENKKFDTSLIKREETLHKLIKHLENKQIIIITGLRRIGKTSLIKQLIEHLIETLKVEPKYILYVSLDHYLLQKHSILEIVEKFMQIGQIKFGEKMYLFFDEVTHQGDFEIQLKNLFDLYQAKIYISSSSAGLLKSKKPFLTGRNQLMEIQPLGFTEYLQFKEIQLSEADKHLMPQHFKNYLTTGGIPEYVLKADISYLTELVDDIIFKDIAAHHQIRQPQILKEYYLLLMERAGKQLSINKIASILKITPDTSRRYLEMFADTFLIHLMGRFGKTNETLLSAKKVYAADLGLRCAYTGMRDFGSLFENYIYLKLKHLNPKYFYQNGTELDFITENKWVVESKFHDEPLNDKQQKMYDSLPYERKAIIRSFADIETIDFDN